MGTTYRAEEGVRRVCPFLTRRIINTDVVNNATPPPESVSAPAKGRRSKSSSGPADTGVSRRRLLTVSALTALVSVGAGATATKAVGTGQKRLGPTDRVAPRPEQIDGQVGTDVFWRCAPKTNKIALTFDDGPDPRWTPVVLDALAQVGAHATFFQHGNAVLAEPALAREVAAAGHELANHGTGHLDLTQMSTAQLRENLGSTHDAIVETTAKVPTLLRPPWGRIDSLGLMTAAELGYRVALWSHHLPTDGAEHTVDHNIATAAPGMIVLCHDGRSTPADSLYVAVRRLLRELTDSGYEFVTVSDLASS